MEENKINIWWLLLGASVLMAAAWFMKPFPLLIFFGMAPLFAISDHTIEGENFWENIEFILIALAISFGAAFLFNLGVVVKILVLAIVFTLPFLAFAFVHENLGAKTGKFLIILFWLALEYAMVKVQWPANTIYLADALTQRTEWTRWNLETGFLGASAWILISNWVWYAAVLRNGFNGYLIALGVLVVLGPLAYSYSLDIKPILRAEMVNLYQGGAVDVKKYQANGELVARTCGWLSLLVLGVAFVKSRISK